MLHHLPRPSAKFAAGLFAGLALTIGSTVWAVADGQPETDNVRRVVPYDGLLELDGEAVHGGTNMQFRLFSRDAASGGTVPPANQALWSEEWSNLGSKSCSATSCQVDVRAGRFAVQLGRHVNIMPAIAAADDVCLAISVRGASSWVPLGGCQDIVPAPYALWSASGSNPQIAGNLTVNGSVTAGSLATGAVSASNITASSLNASGAVTGQSLTSANVTQAGTGVRINGGGVWQGTGRPSTNDLGFYSNTNGRHIRYVTNNAPHRFFTDAASNRVGSSVDFEINAAGRTRALKGLDVSGSITGLGGGFSISGEHTTGRHNSEGTDTKNLGVTTSQGFCFLAKAHFADIDGGDESASCRVYVSSGRWYLRSQLWNTGDADAWCGARCVTWN